MTATEKLEIYNLLKKSSDLIYGFSSPDFPSTTPSFLDDTPQKPSEIRPAISSQDIIDKESVSPAPAAILENISAQISKCSRCPLAKTRHNTVPGTGVINPYVLVLGEGPGYEEDMQGQPFVGPAGQLLDKMLAAISLSRSSNTFITNIVKCRPPMNRNPYPEEAQACRSFLQAQIALLKPKAILCVGTVAAKNLLQTDLGVTKLRGHFYEYASSPVAVTYHPSALLRDSQLKRPAWEDLKQFRTKLMEICPEYEKHYIPYVR